MEKNTALEELNTNYAAMIRAQVETERAVHRARNAGASWAEIAARINTSKQNAQQKYSKSSASLIAADKLDDAPAVARYDAANQETTPETPSIFLDTEVPAPVELEPTTDVEDQETTPETPSIFLDTEVPAPVELEPTTDVDDQDDRAAFWEAKRRYAVTDCGAIYAPKGEHGWKLHDVVRNVNGKFHKREFPGMAELLHEFEGVLWINNDRYDGLVKNTAHSRETWIIVAADKANKNIVSVSAHRELSKEIDAMRASLEEINAKLKAKRTRKTTKKA